MSQQPRKKRSIPKVLKDHCWSVWVGDDVARTQCLCCGRNEIRMNNFHCGHVVAEARGGEMSVENLRPVCATCNLSMGSENMDAFRARCGFGPAVHAVEERPVERPAERPADRLMPARPLLAAPPLLPFQHEEENGLVPQVIRGIERVVVAAQEAAIAAAPRIRYRLPTPFGSVNLEMGFQGTPPRRR